MPSLITCQYCGTHNNVAVLQQRSGRCRQCNNWIMLTDAQARAQRARRRAQREAERPTPRRRRRARSKPTIASQLATAEKRLASWRRKVTLSALAVTRWERRVEYLRKRMLKMQAEAPHGPKRRAIDL